MKSIEVLFRTHDEKLCVLLIISFIVNKTHILNLSKLR